MTAFALHPEAIIHRGYYKAVAIAGKLWYTCMYYAPMNCKPYFLRTGKGQDYRDN